MQPRMSRPRTPPSHGCLDPPRHFPPPVASLCSPPLFVFWRCAEPAHARDLAHETHTHIRAATLHLTSLALCSTHRRALRRTFRIHAHSPSCTNWPFFCHFPAAHRAQHRPLLQRAPAYTTSRHPFPSLAAFEYTEPSSRRPQTFPLSLRGYRPSASPRPSLSAFFFSDCASLSHGRDLALKSPAFAVPARALEHRSSHEDQKTRALDDVAASTFHVRLAKQAKRGEDGVDLSGVWCCYVNSIRNNAAGARTTESNLSREEATTVVKHQSFRRGRPSSPSCCAPQSRRVSRHAARLPVRREKRRKKRPYG